LATPHPALTRKLRHRFFPGDGSGRKRFGLFGQNRNRLQRNKQRFGGRVPFKHFIILLSALLSACSTTITPLRSTLNKLEAKIENPQKGKIYRMTSSGHGIGVTGKLDGRGETISFDISGSPKEAGKCYYFYEGENYVPIKDKVLSFSNPAIESYVPIINAIEIAENIREKNKKSLDLNIAYRGGQCVLLSTNIMPEKPSSACSPQEEASFSKSTCGDNAFSPTLLNRVTNGTVCVVFGKVAGATLPYTGLLGLITSVGLAVACGIVGGKIGEEGQYNRCLEATTNDCRKKYTEWANKIRYLENNWGEFLQKCIEAQQTMQRAATRMQELNIEANNAAQTWVPIAETHYCR
jgi:hypothetical protein